MRSETPSAALDWFDIAAKDGTALVHETHHLLTPIAVHAYHPLRLYIFVHCKLLESGYTFRKVSLANENNVMFLQINLGNHPVIIA